jgi:hypothetical protein
MHRTCIGSKMCLIFSSIWHMHLTCIGGSKYCFNFLFILAHRHTHALVFFFTNYKLITRNSQ